MNSSDLELAQLVGDYDPTSLWAWESYKGVILELAKGKKVLEVGAGRAPLFTLEEIKKYDISYTANDISKNELEYLSIEYTSSFFDICGSLPEHDIGVYDLVFSKMVQEHVGDGYSYYSNISKLLKRGGISLSFHPTLYSSPFVLNFLLPEKVSRSLLQLVFPNRNNDGIPKFPAKYQYCRNSGRVRRNILRCGFSDVIQVPFWGHSYYDRLFILGFIQQVVSKVARRYAFKSICSFSYTICKK